MIKQKGSVAIWVIIVAVVAVGGWFLLSSDTENGEEVATSTEQEADTEATADESMSRMQAAIAGSGSVECTYTGDEAADAVSYIKAGEIRTVAQAEGMTSNMLFQDEQVYVWQEGAAQGFIFSAEEDQDIDDTPVPVRPDDVEEAAGMENVSCVEADLDDTLFDLPDGVEFMSMADMSTGAAGQIPSQ